MDRMDAHTIKKYEGKKVQIILNNNFRYTTIIPKFTGSCFKIIDKFGKEIEIECSFISFIEVKE